MSAHQPFKGYTTTIDGQLCYFAGLPGYPRNFSRDVFTAGIIAADRGLLASQLTMSRLHQGKKYDRVTGEEPGKIHHEYPGVAVREPYLSTYNACDTAALYLIGLEFLGHLDNQAGAEFLATHRATVELALGYIQNHLRGDIFWEYPPENAPQYSLCT